MNKKLRRLAVELGIILALSLVAFYALLISDQRESTPHLAVAGGILAAIRTYRIYFA